jgi:SHS2 domain-containing protein
MTHLNTDVMAVFVFRQGCIFDPEKHGQGTEIKAITYSNMQIHNADTRVDLYVIVDI